MTVMMDGMHASRKHNLLLASYFLCIGLVILVNVQVATSVRMVARKFKSIHSMKLIEALS